MKPLRVLVLVLLASPVLAACGSEDQAGADLCRTYQTAMADTPEAIADAVALDEIKSGLSDADEPTRQAFSALITAADTDMFSRDPYLTDEKAAEVRAVCLSEHSVEIEN